KQGGGQGVRLPAAVADKGEQRLGARIPVIVGKPSALGLAGNEADLLFWLPPAVNGIRIEVASMQELKQKRGLGRPVDLFLAQDAVAVVIKIGEQPADEVIPGVAKGLAADLDVQTKK